MTDEREDRIRERAQQLWEQDGMLGGKRTEHSEQATREVDEVQQPPGSPIVNDKPAAAKSHVGASKKA